jgi:hypothetical protein
MFLLEQYHNVNPNLVCKSGGKQMLVHYDKKKLTTENATELSIYRSVVFNSKKELVSFSPPKSVPFQTFKEEFSCDSSCIEEFIDGTMINMFYDNEWCISTKTNIGANCRFYNDAPTFKDLFYDTMKCCSVTVDDFDPQVSYSFVLQHPLIRIVTPVVPALYLVSAYTIERAISDTSKNFVHELNVHELVLPKTILFPKRFKHDSYEQPFAFHDWKFKGYMFKNNHVRSKLMNPDYVNVKELRNNQPKLKYHYLTVRNYPDKKATFLIFYPELSDKFKEYGLEIDLFTTELYNHYQNCFIKKTALLSTFPYKFKKHMYALHGMYLASRVNTSMNAVKKYVSSLHPSVLMHTLNCGHLFPPKDGELKKSLDKVADIVAEPNAMNFLPNL